MYIHIPIRVPCGIQAFPKHFRLMLLVGQFNFNKGIGCLTAFVHNWQIARSLYLDPHFAWHFASGKMLGHTDKPAPLPPYYFTQGAYSLLYPICCLIRLRHVMFLYFK